MRGGVSVVRGPWSVAGLLMACSLAVRVIGSEPEIAPSAADSTMVLIIGAPGAEEYTRLFDEWAERWTAAAEAGGTQVRVVGKEEGKTASGADDRDRLNAVLTAEMDGTKRPLWIVMIGHGTFDGRLANFNLRGKDVSAQEVAAWLADCERPLAIVNCASASAPFIDRLAGPDRVIVTATKAGGEVNFARFGDYLSRSISDLSADLDKDGQTSLLEAFLMASRQTQAYYDGQRQLPTEHALLDDNGDARGVRADFFSGLEPTVEAEAGETLDGRRAHQWYLVPSEEERRLTPAFRRRRDELELQLAGLRDQKSELGEDEYFRQIEPLLLEIARLYESAETSGERESPDVPVLPASGN